jgi:hemoglobin
MSRSLYDKIGGFHTVSSIVLNFYGKVLESDEVSPFFAAVDMPKLIDHQTQFICALLGGPASFSDDQIRSVHRPAAITPEAFDHAVALFEQSLKEAELEPTDIETAVRLFEGKRAFVVSR